MLTIRDTKVFHGPNLWAPVPAIVLRIDIGELEERLTRETPIFFERLVALVPSLHDQGDVVSQAEGGLQRLLLDRLALALQQLAATQVALMQRDLAAGAELTYAATHPTNTRGLYRVVYAYEHEAVGLAAGTLAVRLLNHLIVKREPDFDFTRELETTLVSLVKQHAYPLITRAIMIAAARCEIPLLVLNQGPILVQLGTGAYQRHFSAPSTIPTASFLAVRIATNKDLTNRLLREAGLPIPQGTVVRTADEAVRAAAAIGYPVVVKPLSSLHAHGVTIDVRDETEVREAFLVAAKGKRRRAQVVVEKFIPGTNYRILVINNQVVAVLERLPAHVIGDGTHTVAQLIKLTNADPRRGVGTDAILRRITVDQHTSKVLAKQELTLEHVPEAGRFVPLKQIANAELGGANNDRTDEIHPDNVAMACYAAKIIGLDIAGIDFITPDIALSAHDQGGAINEVNGKPGYRAHIRPTEGTPRDLGRAIVDMLFPSGQPVRAPIVAITGTNGKTTTTRLIAHILTTAGRKVGMTTSDGMCIDGIWIAAGDHSDAAGARMVLRNPAVEAAVLETASESIMRDGLGFAHCDVAVVTNAACHDPGTDKVAKVEELARVNAVVPRSVAPEGASILNADDEWTVEMAETAGGEVIFYSLDEENPVIGDHLRKGGTAVVLRNAPEGQMLTLLTNTTEIRLLLAQEIPATLDGHNRLNVQNALAAVAAAFAQDVPQDDIRNALRTFPLNGV